MSVPSQRLEALEKANQTRCARAAFKQNVAVNTVADNWVTLEKAIKVLRATYPEPHYIIVTPTVEH